MKRNNIKTYLLSFAIVCSFLTSCSSTSGISEEDQLFAGLTKIDYKNYDNNDHFISTQEEIEAALATAPNGAFLGSSFHRTPFPLRLWIWNTFSSSNSVFGKWMTKSFGKAPVLMSWVNPALRASVAKEVLRSHGYFHGSVDYEVVKQKNPKEAKIGYTVNLGHLFTIDSLKYVNFPQRADSIIQSNLDKSVIRNGDPFDVATLDAERTRISNDFRNNGYYYYQSGYASYLADTLAVPGKALMHFQLADDIPAQAKRKWYIGKINLQLRRNFSEVLEDSFSHRHFTVHFSGKHSPVRPRVILHDLKLRPKQLYSYEKYVESAGLISGKGLFSMVDFKFNPRDTTSTCDTLDLNLNCIFDKPYDLYFETNMRGKTSGSMGPELVFGITKRNLFRGGEKLNINLNGTYEWQTGHSDGTDSKVHSYEYGADASIEFPRLILPFMRRRRFQTSPSTIVKASFDVVNRSKYFKRHVVTSELKYHFQPSATTVFEFSPLTLKYEYMSSCTTEFSDILEKNPYLMRSMEDLFVPQMRLAYTYNSPTQYHNPVYINVIASESANLLSLGYMATGKKWDESGKTMFKNVYAQFVKLDADFRKTWQTSLYDQLVAHVSAGVIWSYGNSEAAPYSEQFYVGGANSIRAFNVRSVGPGSYYTDVKRLSYLDQTGDLKLQANIEYRPRILGNLYGAIFVDAGNVWALHNDGYRNNSQLKMKNLLKEIAVGTGVGVRYDLDFFVIRIDWGIGLHLPYKPGFYNIGKFKDGQCIHFAIGYPF